MNKYVKFILWLLVCIIFMVSVFFLYDYLKDSDEIQNELQNIASSSGNQEAIDFEVLDSNQERVKLSNYFGKPIVINAWASWCTPCCAELPHFQKAYEKYSGDVEFLMINLTDGISETPEGTLQFVQDNNYSFPIYFDLLGQATKAYGIYSIPRTLFINESGEVVKDFTGMINEPILEDNILNIL
ncbi:MAG: TlpA family protein disulfide reductase [Clostridia bacterium]|nr:TlpA family protein disulfide reductase [Clostridia bacterium]